MSINLLRSFSVHRHGLRDDMESLYYVVLYSGICWLPHNAVVGLGVKMKKYFFDCQDDGKTITGGFVKRHNLDYGEFSNQFIWTDDKATRLWMRDAWIIQSRETLGDGTWTPVNFMEIYSDATKLDPARFNKCKNDVLINGRNIYSLPPPATNSCVVSQISRVMSGMMSKSNNKKRSLQEINKEEKETEPSPVASRGSDASYKKRRAGTADASSNGPIFDSDEDPFLS